MRNYFFFCVIYYLFLMGKCFSQNSATSKDVNIKKNSFTEQQLKNWQHKDFSQDSIPGVSLDRVYKELLKNKKGEKVIVAVIDTELDINHEDLKNSIWENLKEKPNNGIDDDKNGYIDDIHGWNFLGNSKGENIIYGNMESIRIIRKFKNEFENKTEDSVDKNKKSDFLLYKKAVLICDNAKKDFEKDRNFINTAKEGYYKSLNIIKKYFPKNNYNLQKLDSLKNVYKEDTSLVKSLANMQDIIKYNITEKWLNEYEKGVDEKFKSISLDYNDRVLIGDDIDNLNDKNYGNNNISRNASILKHATEVAGILASDRGNTIGINGFGNSIEIMSLSLSAYGDEQDKDIALAIRYAVDNGAKIINMSFGKLISMNQKWVFDAIKYAENKNVLIVAGSGNGGMEINAENNFYPNDNNFINEEISNNFIVVGATTSEINEKFVASFSNYSKRHVDIFAPGAKIFVAIPDNNYKYDSGSSLSAPIVSGIAALLCSYYPKLTAVQIKNIILESGISYNLLVQVPGEKKGVLKPFSELSKSGKIANAYNALLMAEKMSKKAN